MLFGRLISARQTFAYLVILNEMKDPAAFFSAAICLLTAAFYQANRAEKESARDPSLRSG
jgi:hypothetical protein